jgi:flagellar motor switch protein FliM
MSPPVAAARIAPFPFDRLPRLGRDRLRMRKGWLSLLPPGEGPDAALAEAARLLSRRVGRPVRLSAAEASDGPRGELIRQVGPVGVRMIVETAPGGPRLEVLLDRAPAVGMVAALSGSAPSAAADPWSARRPDAAEAGLAGFLLLELLAAANIARGAAVPPMRLLSVEPFDGASLSADPAAGSDPVPPTAEGWSVTLAVEVGRVGGRCQIIGPAEIGASGAGPAPGGGGSAIRRRLSGPHGAGRFGVSLTAVAGTVSLTPRSGDRGPSASPSASASAKGGLSVGRVARLEPFGESAVRPGGDGLAGTVTLIPAGWGPAAGWRWPAEVVADDYARCRVRPLTGGPLCEEADDPMPIDAPTRDAAKALGTAPPATPAETNGSADRAVPPQPTDAAEAADPASAVAGLPLRVAVEMGALRMTVAQLAALHAGQVIELHKSPDEPVTLTVDGRPVARGELVLIDGEVGVRIVRVCE